MSVHVYVCVRARACDVCVRCACEVCGVSAVCVSVFECVRARVCVCVCACVLHCEDLYYIYLFSYANMHLHLFGPKYSKI